MRTRLSSGLSLVASTLLLAGSATSVVAQSLQSAQVGGTTFNFPVGAAQPPGDSNRLFVIEKTGAIRIIDLASNTVLPTPFIDVGINGLNLSTNANTVGDERGLLGLAFDPNYQSNGRFYLNYTDRTNGSTVIRRYTANAPFATSNTANTGSALNLTTYTQPFSNHNGGQVAFGPDGMLYVGSGDGGSGYDPNENAQNLATPLGKILRFDVNNQAGNFVPADNPYAAGQAGANRYIWAYGMRNPWRLSFDRLTGDLWIADVGQDAREEIDFQPALTAGNLATVRNRNYGWDCREGQIIAPAAGNGDGFGCDGTLPGYTDAVTDVPHANGVCSITGGYVYRGTAIPGLVGKYLFSDYCAGFIRSFRYAGTGNNMADCRDYQTQLAPGGGFGGVVSLAEDNAGELYIIGIGNTTNTGRVFKILPANDATNCGCPCFTSGMPTLFADTFETNLGWTTASAATDGAWQRGAPINGSVWTNDPIGDSDGSGQCYLTANRDDNSDVDGGSVTLTSPAMNWAGKPVVICYDYFFFLNNTDSMTVEVSSNGTAGPWRVVATHNTSGNYAWRHNVITQPMLDAALVTNTANMRVRFVAADTGTASVVEAGVDAFRVFDATPTPPSPTDFNGDGFVEPGDLDEFITAFFSDNEAERALTDFNGDGFVEPGDLDEFITSFFEGC
ncbi:MAG: PQQ-dependent sugar dehydrogenase [Phycisphaerales bacterium]